MNRRWVVNASPIIALGRIRHLWVLDKLCRELFIPQSVADEVAAGPVGDPARIWIEGDGAAFVRPNARSDPRVSEAELGAGESSVLPFSASQTSADGTTAGVMAGGVRGGGASVSEDGSRGTGIDASDAGGRADVPAISASTVANAEVAKLAGGDAAAGAGNGAAATGFIGEASTREPRRLDLRIAGAGTLPFALPFSRLSPLSRLTDARSSGSRVTPTGRSASRAAT